MSFPRIASNTTIVQPAEEEKVFPDILVTQILIQGNVLDAFKAYVKYVPYNYDTKEALNEPKNLIIPDISKLAEEKASAGKPELANAITDLCTAIQDELKE